MWKSHGSEPLFREGGGFWRGGGRGRGEGGYLGYDSYIRVRPFVITPGTIGTNFDNG